MPPEADNADTVKPSPQECVGKYQNNDLSIGPSKNMGGRERLVFEYYLIRIRNDGKNIYYRPRISYCGAANRGLNRANVMQQ